MGKISADLYANKESDYFDKARVEIEPFLSAEGLRQCRALEIGCSGGHTLEWLKRTGICAWTAGVEPFAEVDAQARSMDAFFRVNIEEGLPDVEKGSLDLILCLDVLEHLVDPWGTVRRLDCLLKPGGTWIISVPNIRNYRVIADLLFRGSFQYTNAGIMDRTHLRFFTREGLADLASSSGSQVVLISSSEPMRRIRKLLAAFGLHDLLAKQLLAVARKPMNTSD